MPDEGFGALVRLQNRLYVGALAVHQRIDLPIIPHLTVGQFTEAAGLADACNANEIQIVGKVTELTVLRRMAGRVEPIAAAPLN